MAIALAVVGLIALLYYFLPKDEQSASPNQAASAATLPKIVSAVAAGEVKTLAVRGDVLVATKTDGSKITARKESNISAVETLKILGAPADALAELPIVIEEPTANFNPTGILAVLAIVGLITFLIFRNSRQPQGQSGSGYNFSNMGRSNPRVISNAHDKDSKSKTFLPPPVTFRDVAGADQAKLELLEIIEFLKEPDKFVKLGARIPKGVLMAGPPGTGKTLLAKAVAGEAGVPFFSISGSEFVEMFVGVGAARVRDLFKRAREQAPAVVFVDEIDAVGRQRGASMGSGNDEREQTLNQILVEMDGFTTDTNVIVMASTNRPDILDPALLRPGRFDRKVILDRPDVQGREAILEVHTRGKPLAPDISILDLAKLTPGFVGADLENLVNEAAILAARRNLNMIGRLEFQDAMERIVAGPERQGKILSDYERKVVAYHEAGHAVVMHNLEHSDPVHKISIISRGMALGYTMPLPEGDKYLRSREAFEDEIVGLLGGRAAEEIIFKRITTGAANDLERATKLARAMVTRFGFSPTLGLRTFGEEQGNPYLGSLGEIRNYSEEMAQTIDHEIRHILDTAYQRAKDIVVIQQRKLEALAGALLEHETVERPTFEALMA
ncbi:MAG: ATP-dependent zinc metalloprotease FtsH [Anaerolineales bacterium]|nr:ATP-dependent zinc metalloprotease FtsH [Anaerolineales bacterium]